MNTLNFHDANVWLALLWGRHIHSERANQWFGQAATEQFFFCRITQITVLRLLTTEGIMGKDVLTMSGACNLWDKIWADRVFHFFLSRKTWSGNSAPVRDCLLPLQRSGRTLI